MQAIFSRYNAQDIIPWLEHYGAELSDLPDLTERDWVYMDMMYFLGCLGINIKDIYKYVELFWFNMIKTVDCLVAQDCKTLEDLGVKVFHAKKITFQTGKVDRDLIRRAKRAVDAVFPRPVEPPRITTIWVVSAPSFTPMVTGK